MPDDTAHTAEFARALPIEQLAPSPFNPRRQTNVEALAELTASIVEQGILQPIVVRPITDSVTQRVKDLDTGARYQIVAGHRRVLAARDAGLATVPAIVRAMTDAELKAAHLTENLQRENLAALEEAEGYGRLRDDEGLTAVQIAQRIGRKPGVVHNRLKLLELCPEGRAALESGAIGAEVGQLIARIPVAKLQLKALARATERGHRGEPKSYREIRDLLVDEFTLRLSEAIFDRDDALLLPAAGACTACVKRSGGDHHLFSDIIAKDDRYGIKSGEQICTDPDCFAAKKAAHLARQAEKLAAQGKEVVTGAAARKALAVERSWDGRSPKVSLKGTEFIELAEVKDQLAKAAKAAKKAKGQAAAAPAVKPVIIQDSRTGKTLQAVRRKDLEAAGVKVAETSAKQRQQDRTHEKLERERAANEAAARIESARRRRILDAVRTAIRATARTAFDLGLVARVAWAGVDWDDRELLAELWGEQDRDHLAKRIGQLGVADLTLFLVDCALVSGLRVGPHDMRAGKPARPDVPLLAAAAHYGIDVAAIAPADEPAAVPAAKSKRAAQKEPKGRTPAEAV